LGVRQCVGFGKLGLNRRTTMKSVTNACWLTGLVMLTLTLVTATEEKPGSKPQDPPGFARLKALSGEWTATPVDEKKGHGGGKVMYKVTAGGSAIAETLFPGSDHEMLTVYHAENGDLVMTHYCMLGNQPKMRAEPGSDAKKLIFKCVPGGSVKCATEEHMHQCTMTFIDDDHIKTEWVLFKEGKEAGTHAFLLERKKV
jgi:hypothetical protein